MGCPNWTPPYRWPRRLIPATPATSRRALVAGIAAAPALALPALAGEPHPDAALLALVVEFEVVERDYAAANALDDEKWREAQALLPTMPDALRRKGDFRHFYGLADNLHSPIFYTAGEVDGFRRYQPAAGDLCEKARREASERAQEIVAAFDGWQAEWQRAYDETGHAAAEEAYERAYDRRSAVVAAAMKVRPTTLAGIHAKARIWAAIADAESIAAEFDRAMRDDLLALGGQV